MIRQRLTDAMTSSDPETKLWKSRFAAAKGAYSVGEFRQCESLLYRLMEQAESLHEWAFATNTCHVGLGALYLGTGKLDKAREQLQTAINALSGAGEPALRELYAVALRFYSRLLFETGDYTGAEGNLQTAITILEDLGDEAAVPLAYTLSDLATLYVVKGDLKEAKSLIYSAMYLLESVLGSENPEYVRASIIYNICDSKDDKELLTNIEDGIFRMQYHEGQHHPNIIRALEWYLRKRQERGEAEEVAEAKERFDLHKKTIGA